MPQITGSQWCRWWCWRHTYILHTVLPLRFKFVYIQAYFKAECLLSVLKLSQRSSGCLCSSGIQCHVTGWCVAGFSKECTSFIFHLRWSKFPINIWHLISWRGKHHDVSKGGTLVTSEAAPYPRRKFSSSVTRTFVLLLSYLRLSLCTHCQISFSHLSTHSLTSVSHLCTYSRISLSYICALSLILDSHICALTLESPCLTFLHSLSYLRLSFVHSLSNLCLTFVHSLSYLRLSFVHSLSYLRLSFVHSLSYLRLSFVHSLSNLCLTFVHSLSYLLLSFVHSLSNLFVSHLCIHSIISVSHFALSRISLFHNFALTLLPQSLTPPTEQVWLHCNSSDLHWGPHPGHRNSCWGLFGGFL
jgi:hypothetical protein